MASISWLHLSDWHQQVYKSRKDKNERRKVVLELLRDVRRQQMTGHVPSLDFIVFSGDIAQSGSVDQYTEAFRSLCSPLLRFTGVPQGRCFVVPGNHDVDREVLRSLPSHLQKPIYPLTFDTLATDKLAADPVDGDLLHKPFKNFRNFASGFRADADQAYSDTFSTDGGTMIEIVALNSALYCGRQSVVASKSYTQDYGGLFVGERQLAALPPTPSPRLGTRNGPVRIAILHHPFPWFYQAEQTRLQEALFDRVHFVLVGHEHNQRVEEAVSNYGDVVVIPAGPCYDREAASGSDPSDRYGMAYNLVRLDTDGMGWTGRVWLRRWHSTVRSFRGDTRYPTLPGGSYPFRCLGLPPADRWTPPPGGGPASISP